MVKLGICVVKCIVNIISRRVKLLLVNIYKLFGGKLINFYLNLSLFFTWNYLLILKQFVELKRNS